MKKKVKPTELSANLQPTSKENSRSRLPSKGKIDSSQPTQKKVHRKLLSIPDSYYFLNIYKNSTIDKSKRSRSSSSAHTEEPHTSERATDEARNQQRRGNTLRHECTQ
jgi:hypothetical protein